MDNAKALCRPMITWGPNFSNTLTFGYPLDVPVSYATPRAVSIEKVPSGDEDAWIQAIDYYLDGTVRWVEHVAGLGYGAVGTPWHGATGFSAFIVWAQEKNAFRFYPDQTDNTTYQLCYLVEPSGAIEQEKDKTRKFKMTLRSAVDFTGY